VTPTTTPTASATPAPTSTITPESTATYTATPVPPTATLTRTVTPTLAGTKAVLPAAVTTQPPTPALTPQGGGYGQVAFASDRSGVPQIYLSDLSGLNAQAITDLPGGACQPSWSPDGSRLVFVSPCAGPNTISLNPARNTSLYIIGADGSQLTTLTDTPGGDIDPAWSPDGTRIAFTSFRDGSMQLYSLDLADQNVTRLTNLGSGIEARQPAWSPSSGELLFTVRRSNIYQVWVMNADGSNARQIVRSGQDFWDYDPAWSQGSSALVFSQRRASGPSSAWPMSASYDPEITAAASRLSMGNLPVEQMTFSPDGFWIVFTGQEADQNTDIYFVTAAGAERTRLTTDPARDFDPAWRPMGNGLGANP